MRGMGSRVDIRAKHRKENDMKKLMVMFLGVAFAACAMAFDVESYITPYEKDTNPCDANVSWYSYYFMTADAITAATGGSVTSVDAAAYAEWLQTNFADNKAATVSNASFILLPTENSYFNSEYGQYALLADSPMFAAIDFLGVCFFDNQTDSAFEIIKENDICYDVDDYGVSNWIPVSSTTNVPEPTSGLMLLLGLAGLALKRKAV